MGIYSEIIYLKLVESQTSPDDHRATPRQSVENRFGGISDGIGARLPPVEPKGASGVD
jgi:hypothetical protein